MPVSHRTADRATILIAALLTSIAAAACGSSPASSDVILIAPEDASTDDATLHADEAQGGSVGTDASRDSATDASSSARDAPADMSVADDAHVETGTLDAGLVDGDAVADTSDATVPETGAADGGTDGPTINAGHGDPTPTVLAAQGDDCLPCATRNGCLDPALLGGACEDMPNPAPSACTALFADITSVTETQVCLATLNTIFASKCAATLQGETPCLCAAADPGSCLAGDVSAAGAAFPLYACDFTPLGIATITTNFTNQAFGAGQANALVQCLAMSSCDCFASP